MAVALLVAAGSGERLGAERPKAFVELAGRPLLQWSIDALAGVRAIERIVVALPPDVPGLPAEIAAPAYTQTTAGGSTRSESVRLALEAAGAGDPVLVHDAARPLLTAELAERVLAAAERDAADGAIAAAPVTDTIKQAGEDGVVLGTLERAALWAVQTPQVFRRAPLERALAVPRDVLAQATDDAWLLERSGCRVLVVPAPRENIKVTTALDLIVAEGLLERRASRPA
jgi:2-C-methyl-D-erythritol 4-phosphate cytidylyltransferase